MKKESLVIGINKSKLLSINILFISSLAIIFLGIFFSIYSLMNNIYFNILSSKMSGAVLGLLVFYLGIRYYLSVERLKSKLFKTSSTFSWSNFKKDKSK